MTTKSEGKTGLELLRVPFAENHISKLPKPTKQQTEAVKANFKAGIRCKLCGAWHHPDVVHLDYVGHAALTDRLLDADITWSWEPMSFGPDGLPALDRNGGIWIRLTVCGVTRIGYGSADGKQGGDAIKEVIGDALRNAGMRFGAALDLWHKGDLHGDDERDTESVEHKQEDPALPPPPPPPTFNDFLTHITNANTIDGLQAVFKEAWRSSLPKSDKDDIKAAYEQKKAELTKPANLGQTFVPADFDSLQSEHHGDRV